MSPAVIAFDNVSKRYGGAAPVLDGVSLEVREREFLAIVGPSGSGKTTLLRLVNRLIDPTAGTVRVEGEDVRSIDAVTLRRRIGYVFQGVGLFPHMTVAENIAITPKLLGWDDARMAARVDTLLELVRLDRAKHRDRFPAQLSGGEGQRVGVARALAAEPTHRADGRAVRRARSAHPRRARRRLPAAARRARPDQRDDHPRHAGGGAARRPHRRDPRRPHRRRRHAARADERRAGRLCPRPDGDAAPPGRAAHARSDGSEPVHDPQLAEAFARLPAYLGGHVAVSVDRAAARPRDQPAAGAGSPRAARRCATCCSAPPAWCRPSRAWRCWRCSIRCCSASPPCASALFGAGFSALGFLPSVLALTLYSHAAGAAEHHHRIATASIPPINEAALGVGMTPRQSLFMVELPLALPVIMAGIRTAAVWVIGAATLSTPIGQTSLGNYIFTGLQTQNWVFVLFGCVAAAVFALRGRSTAGADGNRADAAQARPGSRPAASGAWCC